MQERSFSADDMMRRQLLPVRLMPLEWQVNSSPLAARRRLGLCPAAARHQSEFFPCAAAILTDGQVEMIAAHPDNEQPRSAKVIARIAAVVSQRDDIRISAIVADVRLAGQASDAIRVDLRAGRRPGGAAVLHEVEASTRYRL